MDSKKRIWLMELLIDCPLEYSLDTCPAKELREMKLSERLKIIDEMSDDEMQSILEYHKKCLAERERQSL